MSEKPMGERIVELTQPLYELGVGEHLHPQQRASYRREVARQVLLIADASASQVRSDQDLQTERLAHIIGTHTDEATASAIVADLLNDRSWLPSSSATKVLISIEASGEMTDLDAARLLDALGATEHLAEVHLLGAGQPATFSAVSYLSNDRLRDLAWRLAEDEGIAVLDVQVHAR